MAGQWKTKSKVKEFLDIMDLIILDNIIKNEKIDDAIYIIEEIGEKKCMEALPFLIEKLESTDNHLLRNAIALALSDIGSPEAIEPIINMIRHPKTKGYRGTLLSALEPFDYSEHIELLVNLLYEGNFEVSRKSLILIEAIIKNTPNEIRQRCISVIRNEIEKLEDKIDFLLESIDVFTEE